MVHQTNQPTKPIIVKQGPYAHNASFCNVLIDCMNVLLHDCTNVWLHYCFPLVILPIFLVFENCVTIGHGRTDGQTDGPIYALTEMLGRI